MYDLTQSQIKDLSFFEGHVDSFMNDDKLRYKHLIIADCKVIESFDGLDTAVQYAAENLKPGEYIISQVLIEDEIVNFI